MPGFMYLMAKLEMASFDAIKVFGYSPETKDALKVCLPLRSEFVSLGDFADYPAKRWGAALELLLRKCLDDGNKRIALFLEDYWLVRQTPNDILNIVDDLMDANRQIARFDLAAERLHCGGWTEAGPISRYDIIQQTVPQPYSLSFQASVWDCEKLLDLVRPNETPWETELLGTERFNERIQNSGWIICGTRQWPYRYCIVCNKGQTDMTGAWMRPQTPVPNWLLERLDENGYLPKG